MATTADSIIELAKKYVKELERNNIPIDPFRSKNFDYGGILADERKKTGRIINRSKADVMKEA